MFRTHRGLLLSSLFVWTCLFLMGCGNRPHPQPDSGTVLVTVSQPLTDQVTLFTDLTGSVAAPETVQVRPRVSGFIKAVLFSEGKLVEKDKTVLFEIDPVMYNADLKQADAQIDIGKAQLELALADEAREKLAYDKGATSKQNYESFVAKRKVADAQLASYVQQKVKAQQNVEWTKVVAPISGRADRAFLTAGNVVTGGETQGTVMTTIVSVDPMYVYFDADDQTVSVYQKLIHEKKLKTLDEGGTVEVDIQLLGETGYPRHGTISFVSNQLNPTTGTLSVRGVFPNPDRMLLPGRYVRGRVPVGKPFPGLLIPDAAVVTDQGRKVVYVIGQENKAEARPVTLGPQVRGLRMVESGLTAADRIVIRGAQRVQGGMTLEPEDGTISYPEPKDAKEATKP
jgi:RND family efflux transporter MFP subunit